VRHHLNYFNAILYENFPLGISKHNRSIKREDSLRFASRFIFALYVQQSKQQSKCLDFDFNLIFFTYGNYYFQHLNTQQRFRFTFFGLNGVTKSKKNTNWITLIADLIVFRTTADCQVKFSSLNILSFYRSMLYCMNENKTTTCSGDELFWQLTNNSWFITLVE
jgi:hypothetical protein